MAASPRVKDWVDRVLAEWAVVETGAGLREVVEADLDSIRRRAPVLCLTSHSVQRVETSRTTRRHPRAESRE